MIPIIPIKQNTPKGCFSACLRMVLTYYDITASEEEIDAFVLKDKEGGSFLTELSRFAVYKGKKAKCYSYNLYINDPKDNDIKPKERLTKLQQKLSQYKSAWHQQLIKSTIQAIQDGVEYILLKPNLADIDNFLQRKIPLIITVNYAALYNKQGDPFEGHDIVLVGKDGENILFIDPMHGSVDHINKNDLLFGLLQRKIIAASAYMLAIES